MCGILGITSREPVGEMELAFLAAGTRLMTHRGPDAEGLWHDTYAGLGHRRLAVIDLVTGSQPMSDATGRYVITFNGEIYNYREIRTELGKRGCTFRTNADTEVILNAYAVWNTGCLARLDGIFAFAIWDTRERSLLLARDHIGVKPLLYAADPSRCLFASELKPLLLHPSVRNETDPLALSDYLSLGYILAPKTILKGVSKLPPASFLLWKDGQSRVSRYWDMASAMNAPPFPVPTYARATDTIRGMLDNAVKRQLVSDVPVGTFLSGGIDSTTVTERMTRFYHDQVHTFSVGFKNSSYSELPFADRAATHLKTCHHVETIDPDLNTVLPSLAWFYDEPFSDTSALPTALLCRLASKQLKVVLSGDGGDECFAGYDTYVADKMRAIYTRLVPRFIHNHAILPLARELPASHRKVSLDYEMRQFCEHAYEPSEQAHYSWRLLFSEAEKKALLSPDIVRTIGDYTPFDVFRERFAEVPDAPFLNRAQYVDFKTWLADCMLVKVDRASMAFGLEVRVPLLAPELVSYALSLPPAYKLRGFRTKAILKHAVADRVPAEIIHRRKRGFNSPVAHWVNGLEPDQVSAGAPEMPGFTGIWNALLGEHSQHRADNGFKLWTLLLWSRWTSSVRVQPDRAPGTIA